MKMLFVVEGVVGVFGKEETFLKLFDSAVYRAI